jgi:cysteinyl-tRNA synthetase
LNFTFDGLNEARQSLLRLDEWVHRLEDIAANTAPASDFVAAKSDGFFEALDDDLNISAALAQVFDQVRATNRSIDRAELTEGQAGALLQWWDRINRVLQLQEEKERVPEDVRQLLQLRGVARTRNSWSESDAIRMQIEALGWSVKDTKEGQKLIKKPR